MIYLDPFLQRLQLTHVTKKKGEINVTIVVNYDINIVSFQFIIYVC